MAIFIYSLWWGGIALELLLLIRAIRTKLKLAYPIFYFYILFVLTQSFIRIAVHRWDTLYSYVYWGTEFIGVIIGCGIVYEIYRVGLAAFPGTARMARLLLTVLFVMALAKALADVSSDPRWWAEATTVDIERAMRTVQAAAILALAALFLVYRHSFRPQPQGNSPRVWPVHWCERRMVHVFAAGRLSKRACLGHI